MTNPLLKVSSCKSLDANSTGLVTLIKPLALKEKPIKDRPHFLEGRFGTKFGNGKRVRHGSQPVDFVIVRKLKTDLHLVHRYRAGLAHASLPVPYEARVDAHDVLVVGLSKSFVGEVNGLVEKGLRLVLGHCAIVERISVILHSYFPKGGNAFIFASRCLSTPLNSVVRHL